MLAHINIGSNIGDSRSVIERAVAHIFSLSEGIRARSNFIETEPWGFESPNNFLNIGVEIETSLTPTQLLSRLQEIEQHISPAAHRNADGTYRDRVIDIDLIVMADPDFGPDSEYIKITTPGLTLPHPRASVRGFVMTPLIELHPDFNISLLAGDND